MSATGRGYTKVCSPCDGPAGGRGAQARLFGGRGRPGEGLQYPLIFSPLTPRLRLANKLAIEQQAIRRGYAVARKSDTQDNKPAAGGRKAGEMFQRAYGAAEFAEAEKMMRLPRKSDVELAREYAEMMEAVWLDRDELDATALPPDRRFFRSGREAWVYERGNIAELVFVK